MKYLRFLLLPLWYLAMSCATQTTPQGGPKDTIPPHVVNFYPKENQKNFKGKEITVEFDETVVLNNPKEEIIIVPSLGKKTEFKIKGKMLTIEPELPWRDSTTYNINFREGVRDITENNPAATLDGTGVHLAFSTGPEIDTLSISGSVKSAINESIPENITIAVYKIDTFDIFEDTPEFFTKSNKKDGKFSITNLKAGKYKLYAFEDKNKNLKAETRSEKFGFLSRTIELDSAITNLQISMMNIDTRPPKIQSTRNQSFLNTIRFNKPMVDYDILSDTSIISSFANNQTEILAYYPKISIDSMKIHVRAMDSTEQIVDTLVYIKTSSQQKLKEAFKYGASDASYNLETNIMQFVVNYSKPLKSINYDSIYLEYDSITRLPLKFKNLKVDTIFNRITVNEFIPLDSIPKSSKITIAPSFLVSVEDDSSKILAPAMKLFDSPTTAVLLVNITTKEPHFVIQLVNSSNKVVQEVADQKKITFKFLTPETLKIRAVIDTNGNGKWDPAIYPQNREPEKLIYYINTDRTTDIPLRANWEVGPLSFRF